MTFTSADFVFLLPGESLEDIVWVPKCICDLLYQLRVLPWWHRGKNLPANAGDVVGSMPETQVPSLGQEDPLEQEMVTLFSVLAWKIPQTEESGRLQPMGSQKSQT